MHIISPFIASLFLAPLPALAAEPGGTVTGTIDGKEVELTIFAQQSDHGNSHLSLYIIGDGLSDRGLGALMLGAEWIGELGEGFIHAEISTRVHDNPMRIYYGDEDNGLSITVTDFSRDGDILEISGRVEGEMIQSDKVGHKNPDPEDTVAVDLTFEAVVE